MQVKGDLIKKLKEAQLASQQTLEEFVSPSKIDAPNYEDRSLGDDNEVKEVQEEQEDEHRKDVKVKSQEVEEEEKEDAFAKAFSVAFDRLNAAEKNNEEEQEEDEVYRLERKINEIYSRDLEE